MHFNPRSPCGERLRRTSGCSGIDLFQSTLPVRGATCTQTRLALRRNFNPRSPCGERRIESRSDGDGNEFQSTLPVRGATCGNMYLAVFAPISIHAPRAGSDDKAAEAEHKFAYFNPRSPCGERRQAGRLVRPAFNFNPRSPCGERLPGYRSGYSALQISIHAPRAGSDRGGLQPPHGRGISIHAPRAGSDNRPDQRAGEAEISIHAPRAGSDGRMDGQGTGVRDFNPRSPCGERRLRWAGWTGWLTFQSTLPVRGATSAFHLPLKTEFDFNPRSPCGERRRSLCPR